MVSLMVSRGGSRGNLSTPLVKVDSEGGDGSTSGSPEKQHESKSDGAVKAASGNSRVTRIPANDKNIYYWDPKSLRIQTINFWHVFLSEYLGLSLRAALAVLILLMTLQAVFGHFDPSHLIDIAVNFNFLTLEVACAAAVVAVYIAQMKPSIYCMEKVVFVPPKEWQVSHEDLKKCMAAQGCFTEESLQFLNKILERSGTGDATYWPPGIVLSKDGVTESDSSVMSARQESEIVICTLVHDLLQKTKTRPQDIDFLIINCSLFAPTPSLCGMVCHKFQMHQGIKTYNLGGMGCSASLIAVDLAKQCLENSPGSRAMIISTENLTQNLYKGNDKSMLLQNTLFRCGGAAMLLSSRRMDFRQAKYKLLYLGRTLMTDAESYGCVFEKEDKDGKHGVALSKEIVNVAGRALKHNFTNLAPHVLPIREQLKTVINRMLISVALRLKKSDFEWSKDIQVPKGYTPNFTAGIDHFCIHAGGRAVIEGVQRNLKLAEHHIAPSMQTLFDWGNTSSSSIWYEVEWVERFGQIRKGHRILQVAFGSGFKCNSAVWLTLRVDESKRGVPLKSERQETPSMEWSQSAVPCPDTLQSDKGQ